MFPPEIFFRYVYYLHLLGVLMGKIFSLCIFTIFANSVSCPQSFSTSSLFLRFQTLRFCLSDTVIFHHSPFQNYTSGFNHFAFTCLWSLYHFSDSGLQIPIGLKDYFWTTPTLWRFHILNYLLLSKWFCFSISTVQPSTSLHYWIKLKNISVLIPI